MNLDFLDFEQPIAELLTKIEELRYVTTDSKVNISQEIARLESKSRELTKAIFSSLSAIQVVKLARHSQRPHTLDYIEHVFTDFEELFGDRHFAKGAAIIGGVARLNDQAIMIIGQQKGRNTKENLERNFAMPNPEEYRKALRLMELAEKFQLPIFTFIDTPGAYPGIGAEERTVIGEGGSGGALALGVGDKILMLQYSIYATISPEGCASILWRSQDKVAEAAETMHLTADKLFKLKLIDQIVSEPLGGAHRDYVVMAQNLKRTLVDNLNQLRKLPIEKLMSNRYEKLMSFGR